MCFIITSLQCGDINKEQNTVRIQMEINRHIVMVPRTGLSGHIVMVPRTVKRTSQQVNKVLK